MSRVIAVEPLTRDAFAPFGDVLDAAGPPDKMINQGLCGRYNDLARLDFEDGRAGISVFKAEPRDLPYKLDMVERHPKGSQAFLPMSHEPFLVIVAPDEDGKPGRPVAFLTKAGQGVNYHKGIWHGVLTQLRGSGFYAVVDRIGDGDNLEEHWYEAPFEIIGL